jgi:hypothetical protein
MSHKFFKSKWAMLCVAIVAMLGNASVSSADSLTLIIVGQGYHYPEVVFPIISLDPEGSLTYSDGKELDNKDLEKLLRRTKTVAGKETCLLRLLSSREQEVSMQTLGKALRRIQSLASPEVPTIVYVYFRGLKPLDGNEKRLKNSDRECQRPAGLAKDGVVERMGRRP